MKRIAEVLAAPEICSLFSQSSQSTIHQKQTYIFFEF